MWEKNFGTQAGVHLIEGPLNTGSNVCLSLSLLFTPLVFSTTGGMAVECNRCHSRLAKLAATKKSESYATAMSCIRARVSFALLRSALFA